MYSTIIEPDFSRLHIKENVSACSSLRLAHFEHVLFPSLSQLLWLAIIYFLLYWYICISMIIFSLCCFSPSQKFLFLLDSFLLFDIIGHRQLILLLILQRSIYGFNIYHHEVFTLANIADFHKLMEALSHRFEIFVHAFIKSWIYWTFDKFSGPRHHFKILAIGIFGVKVRQWDSSFISASSQHHVAVLRWEEVSTHVDGYLILLLHSTFCRDFIQHDKTLDVGILLLFFFSRWACLSLSSMYCAGLFRLLGLRLRCAVRCARIALNKGSIVRISLLFEDICFAVNKHHCILSTKQWLITNLIVVIILESKLINSFVSILIKDFAIRCHSRKYLLEFGILTSILIILIFQAHHRMLIQIHRIFTLSHAIWHLQFSPGLQIVHMLRKVYQLVRRWNFIMLQLSCIWRKHARPVEPLRLIQIICVRIILVLIIASAIDSLIKGHRPRCAIMSILDSSTFHDSCDILFIN